MGTFNERKSKTTRRPGETAAVTNLDSTNSSLEIKTPVWRNWIARMTTNHEVVAASSVTKGSRKTHSLEFVSKFAGNSSHDNPASGAKFFLHWSSLSLGVEGSG